MEGRRLAVGVAEGGVDDDEQGEGRQVAERGLPAVRALRHQGPQPLTRCQRRHLSHTTLSRQRRREKAFAHILLCVCVCVSVCMCVLLIIYPTHQITLFTNDLK